MNLRDYFKGIDFFRDYFKDTDLRDDFKDIGFSD